MSTIKQIVITCTVLYKQCIILILYYRYLHTITDLVIYIYLKMLCLISIVLSDRNFIFDTLTTGLGTWPMPIIVPQIDISLVLIFINCMK